MFKLVATKSSLVPSTQLSLHKAEKLGTGLHGVEVYNNNYPFLFHHQVRNPPVYLPDISEGRERRPVVVRDRNTHLVMYTCPSIEILQYSAPRLPQYIGTHTYAYVSGVCFCTLPSCFPHNSIKILYEILIINQLTAE